MANVVLVFLFLFFSAHTAFAGTQIDIQAEQLDVDNTTGEAIFTGAVTVTREELTLTADKVVVLYATEDDAEDDIQTINAYGHVKMVTKGRTATADRGIYLPNKDELTLHDNVRLQEDAEGNTLFGTKLLYDLATDRLSLKSEKANGGTGRVRGTFQTATQTNEEPRPEVTSVPAEPLQAREAPISQVAPAVTPQKDDKE